MHGNKAILLIVLCIVLSSAQSVDDAEIQLQAADQELVNEALASDVTGSASSVSNYLVIALRDSSITSRGVQLSSLLNASGAISNLMYTEDLPTGTSNVLNCSAIILDSSLGSDEGSIVPNSVISLLRRSDRPIVLVGRAAWTLHKLKATTTPVTVASLESTLRPDARFTSDATILLWPEPVTMGSLLTQELDLQIPVDSTYHEMSTLVNLTGVDDESLIAPLRHDSWPLDTFLFGPEDPTLWTETGLQLFLNTIAFSTSLSETPLSLQLAEQQAVADQTLAGGYRYFHESTLDGTYWAVRAMSSILTSAEWSTWASAEVSKVTSLLSTLYVDLGSEATFKDHWADASGALLSTAKGLWLASRFGIADFDEAKLVAYLAAEQSTDGGWDSDMTTTYHVTEALYMAGSLSEIDSANLEDWLRSCVITGAKTSDPVLWGGIASGPLTLDASNDHAAQYVLALRMLGTTHVDPAKLTEWILTRTARGDGSYNNTVSPGGETIRGTACALTAMAVMNTLGATEKADGLLWLLSAQLSSGGFGLLEYPRDLQGKIEESALVATSLGEADSASGLIGDGLTDFVAFCEGPKGFELVEPLPTLLWSSWIARAARASHSLSFTDIDACIDYLAQLDRLSEYPVWSNITVLLSPEYEPDQYRLQSVWSQWLGVSLGISLGTGLSAEMRSGVISYVYYAQTISGHYRPTNVMGIAGMQHSVAAVEALFQLDALDQIAYRTQLETAVMSAYSAGQWSMIGWTLRPFVGQQSVIDFLSTRCAVRLGLIDSIKAEQIRDVIVARLQYNDLWMLSADVASLQLLVSSGLISDSALDSVNMTALLDAIESSFSDAWFNSTPEWQPLYTAFVLEMISRLGMRAELYGQMGSSMVVTVPDEVEAGGVLGVDVSIDSSLAEHRVFVRIADQWTRFDAVSDTDTLIVPVPAESSVLGPSDIWVMLWDLGLSRAWTYSQTDIVGTLTGSLVLDTDVILENDLLNGTVSWFLSEGGIAGMCDVTVRLGSTLEYSQWSYVDSSPFEFSVATSGFSSGVYNLTVRINKQYCADLVFVQSVSILEPHATYIVSPDEVTAEVEQQLLIPYELRLLENDSLLYSQTVSLEIWNEYESVVFSDSETTGDAADCFSWTPSLRGNFTFTIRFLRNGTLESSQADGMIVVSEPTVITVLLPVVANQGSTVDAIASLQTADGESLPGRSVHITVTSPQSQVVLDQLFVTDANGEIAFEIDLDENGIYVVSAAYAGEQCLYSTDDEVEIVSWSVSDVQIGGIVPDGLVTDSWLVWSRTLDYSGSGIGGLVVQFQVVFLPSTVVMTESSVTNASGYAVFIWTATSAGSYRVTASYAGCVSRGADAAAYDTTVRIPVLMTVFCDVSQVGTQSILTVYVVDHNNAPISGIIITVTVRDSLLVTVIQETGVSDQGSVSVPWTPSYRGSFTVSATSTRQGLYEAADRAETAGVLEQVDAQASWNSTDLRAVSTYVLSVVVLDYWGNAIPSVQVNAHVTLTSGTLLDSTVVTESDGTYSFTVLFETIGELTVVLTVLDQEYLIGCVNSTEYAVLGLTKVLTSLNGQPITQGKLLGIVITLIDWEGDPIVGSTVRLSVFWSNGTLKAASERVTGTGGTCTFSHVFDQVGDFLIVSSFVGDAVNGPVSMFQIQRVYVVPNLLLQNDVTAILGEEVEFRLGVIDALNVYVAGRPLTLRVKLNDQTVFEAGLLSEGAPKSVIWTPSGRGAFQVELLHPEGTYYLLNSTTSGISVLEVVTAVLTTSSSQLDLFGVLTVNYSLVASECSGIPIVFELLDVQLVPIWSCVAYTSETGLASVQCTMDDCAGILSVRAAPREDALLLGGGYEQQVVVITDCEISMSKSPDPPLVGQSLNITLLAEDELGSPLAYLSVTVSMTDPFGNPVRLGSYSNSITVTVTEGFGSLAFVPTMTGLYHVRLTSSGSSYVRAFELTDQIVIFTQSTVAITNCSINIQVGDNFTVTVRLVDSAGQALIGMDITMVLDGPDESAIGPQVVCTDSTGEALWSVKVNEEGAWEFSVAFGGLGVYLPSASTAAIDVRYGSEVVLTWNPDQDIIAAVSPLIVSVLLTDSSGTPLEGRTLSYAVYHNESGLLYTTSFIQVGTSPETIEVSFDRLGNCIVVFTFAGTTHFYGSSAAVDVFVRGTTSIEILGPASVDRADSESVVVTLTDELGEIIDPQLAGVELSLFRDGLTVSLTSRLTTSGTNITVSLLGLGIGDYMLSVDIENTTQRVGYSETIVFEVETYTWLNTWEDEIPGLVDEEHRVILVLLDSLSESVSGSVQVSLYDPYGNEVYGSPLTQSTTLSLVDGRAEVAWTPSRVGNYTLLVRYVGIDHINGTEFQLIINTRYAALFEVTMPSRVRYSDAARMTVLLRGGSGTVANAAISVDFILNGMVVDTLSTTLNSVGSTQIDLRGRPAGNMTILVSFEGTPVYAPCSVQLHLEIEPIVSIEIIPVSGQFLGENMTVAVVSNVKGAMPEWKGVLLIDIASPAGMSLGHWQFEVSHEASYHVWICPTAEGEYNITATINDLPLVGEYDYSVVVTVISRPFSIPLDAGTTPVVGGGVILGVVAVVLKRKMNSVLANLPVEWNDDGF